MIIYKFLDVYGAEKTIESNSVLLRLPAEFNDPFDCYYYVSKRERKKSFKLFMNYQFFKLLYEKIVVLKKQLIVGKLNTKILMSNLKAAAKTVNERKQYKWMADIETYYKIAKCICCKSDNELKLEFDIMVNNVVEKIRKSFLVSCFSLRNDSILMWSHYAQSHRGVCVEYEIDDKSFREVKYYKKPKSFQLSKVLESIFGHEFSGTKMNYSDDSLIFAIEPLFAKYKGWKYEREIRFVYPLDNSQSRIHEETDSNGKKIWLFDMPIVIKRVYAGCEADNEFVDRLKKINAKIPVTLMEKTDGKYSVYPETKA